MHLTSPIDSLDDETEIIDGELRFIAMDKFRFILMLPVCIALYGIFDGYWRYIPIVAGFAAVCFFFLSGYFVLTETEDRIDRIKRTIKHSAITFIALTVAYLVINIIYYQFILKQDILSVLSLRSVFNFIVLNEWPFEIGKSIWYVQAILYAYIFILILEKLNLLRFDYAFAAFFLVISLCTGEFSNVIYRLIDTDILGYTSLPPNFFTFALPVILLSNFLHRHTEWVLDIPEGILTSVILAGIIITFAEWSVIIRCNALSQTYLSIGYIIVAFTLCKFMLDFRDGPSMNTSFAEQCDFITRIIYFVAPVIATAINIVLQKFDYYEYTSMAIGIPVFIIGFIIADICVSIKYRVFHKDEINKFDDLPEDFFNEFPPEEEKQEESRF